MSVSESELIERARTDPQAFGDLYRRHVDRIYSYVLHRVGNRSDAEDLTARTFYRALTGMPEYTDRGAPFSAWLYRIAHNLVANWHRDRGRHETVSLDCPDVGLASDGSGPAPDVETITNEMVAAAIGRLESDRRALLILKVQGLSNAEIGDVLGRSEGAVKSLYHRTLTALRDDLRATDGSANPRQSEGRRRNG